jgi:hypothetical protein
MKALNLLEDRSFRYNSWGKFFSTGILEKTDAYYDQCLAIEPNEVIGESQYYLIDISLLLKLLLN